MNIRRRHSKCYKWSIGILACWLTLWLFMYHRITAADCCYTVLIKEVESRFGARSSNSELAPDTVTLPSAMTMPEVSADYLQTWPWTLRRRSLCNEHFELFEADFARLRDVTICMKDVRGPDGGEALHDVVNQSESNEFYRFHPGVFTLRCEQATRFDSLQFRAGSALSALAAGLAVAPTDEPDTDVLVINRTALVVTRYEYANNCHSITYYYNAFLMLRYFNLSDSNVQVLLADAHPAEPTFDDVWTTLFGSYRRIGWLRHGKPVRYTDMVWSLTGYHAPVMQVRLGRAPLLEEFRTFFLQKHNVTDDRHLDCEKPHVTFILRRNYVAHPRNPTGKVSRRISNEQQLLDAVQAALGNASLVQGVQMERLNMAQQLQLVANSDVIVGMHGAGLMHGLFLPKHGGIVELFPHYWSRSQRFVKIAEWRSLKYARWVNADPRIEVAGQSTFVAPEGLIGLLKSTFRKMGCTWN